jgi:hypothetical protein
MLAEPYATQAEAVAAMQARMRVIPGPAYYDAIGNAL